MGVLTIKIIKITLPFVLLLFLVKTIISSWDEVSFYLKAFQLLPLIIAFSVLLLVYPQSAYSWFVLLKRLGIKISIKKTLRIWIISNTSRYIPGTVWQYIGRVELLQRCGVSRKEGIVSILYETLLTIVAGFLMSIFAINLWNTIGLESYVIFIGLIIPFALLHPAISNKVLLLLAGITRKERIMFIQIKAIDYLVLLPFFLANFLINGLALSLLTYSFTGSLHLENVFLLSGAYALSWLIGYFSVFAPGGLGVTEAVLTVFLSFQMPLALSSAIAIVYRFLLVAAELVIFTVVLKFKDSK